MGRLCAVLGNFRVPTEVQDARLTASQMQQTSVGVAAMSKLVFFLQALVCMVIPPCSNPAPKCNFERVWMDVCF